jgi:hypothetical protein
VRARSVDPGLPPLLCLAVIPAKSGNPAVGRGKACGGCLATRRTTEGVDAKDIDRLVLAEGGIPAFRGNDDGEVRDPAAHEVSRARRL